MGPGSVSAFQFIPKAFSGVQVWAFVDQSSSSTAESVNHFFVDLMVHRGIVMLEA